MAQLCMTKSSLMSLVGVIADVVGAIAGVIGDVYLAAIDTKLFTIETDLDGILNEALNLRHEQESWFGQMFDRVGRSGYGIAAVGDWGGLPMAIVA